MAKPQGPARLPGNQARHSEEGDTLSPSRWVKVQPNDDAQGQPVSEVMALLPVVGEVDMGEAFAEGSLLVCVSTSGVCLCPGPLPAWLFSQCVCGHGCIGRMSFPFPSIRKEESVLCGTLDTRRCKQTPCKGENRYTKMCRCGGVCLRCWECRSHPSTPP